MAKRPPLNNRINKEDMFKKIMPSSSVRPKPAEAPLPGFGASDDLLDGFSDSLIESSVDAFTDELLNQLPSQPRVFATPAAPTAPVAPPTPADFPDEDFDDWPEPPQIQPPAQTDTQSLGRREAQQVAPPPMLQFTPQQPDRQNPQQFAQQPVQQYDQQSAPQFAQQSLQQPDQQSAPRFAQQPLQQPDQQSAPQFAQQPLQQPNQQSAPQFAPQQPMWPPDQSGTPFAGQPMQPSAQPYYAPQYPGQQFPQPPQNPWGAPPMAAQQSYAGIPFPGTPVQQPHPYPQAAYPPPGQQAWAPEQKTSATVVADSASVVTESVVIQELHSESSPASPTPTAPVKPPEPPAAPVEPPEPEHHIQLDLDIPVSTLLNDYDAFPPLAESSGDFVNVAERIVSAWLDDVIRTIHGCTCEVCRLDIAAYALNRLTPRYVLTEDLTEEALTSRRVVAETVNMLYQAAFQVKECPRH